MGVLRLAANYIESMGAIGFHYGHLQIVYEGSGDPQEIEVQSPFGEHWDELGFFAYPQVRDHLDPEHTTGTDDPNRYQIVTLDVGGRNPDDVWDLLRQVHQQFIEQSPNYSYGLVP